MPEHDKLVNELVNVQRQVCDELVYNSSDDVEVREFADGESVNDRLAGALASFTHVDDGRW